LRFGLSLDGTYLGYASPDLVSRMVVTLASNPLTQSGSVAGPGWARHEGGFTELVAAYRAAAASGTAL